MGKPKISLLTLGCKVNQAETSVMEKTLKDSGFQIVRLDESPELCIINTCTVTSKSDYQSRQIIRRAYKAGAKVIVTGCYSELNKASVKAMPEVKEVIDNKDKYNYIHKLSGNNKGVTLSYANNRMRLFLKVQDGCDAACSYCIIPKARGSSRSVNIHEVVVEANRASDSGYKEIVLTGIHLGAYGQDLRPKRRLSDLVNELLNKTKIDRIRLSSIEITELNDNLIGLFANKRLCKHLHIPLQSGDDRILKSMNRAYEAGYYSDRIKYLLSELPDIALGTDVIVGFPGEGDKEFMNTFNLLEEHPFSYIHVFPFSARVGTKASLLPNNIKDDEKKMRCAVIRGLSERKKRQYMRRYIGKTLDVLIEEDIENGIYRGTSSNYLKVGVGRGRHVKGSLVPVRVHGEDNGILIGNPV